MRTEYWSWIFILVGCKAGQVTCSRWERNRHCIPWQEIWIWRPKRKHTGELTVGLPVRLTRNLSNSQISHAEHIIYSKTNTWELMPATNSNRNEKCYRPLTNFYRPLTQTTSTKHILTAFTKYIPPHTNHLPRTYWPHTNHLPRTYWPHTNHLPSTYRPHTNHLPRTYWPHTNHLPRTYWPLLNFHWPLPDHSTFATDHLYQPHTDHLCTTRKFLMTTSLSLPTTYCTNHLPTTYQWHTKHMPTTYRPHSNHIPTTFTNHIPTAFTNHILYSTVPTTYQPPTDHIPMTYQTHANHIPTTYWTNLIPTRSTVCSLLPYHTMTSLSNELSVLFSL